MRCGCNHGVITIEFCVIKCSRIQIRSGDFPAELTQNSIVKEKALVGAFSVITNLRMDLRFKL